MFQEFVTLGNLCEEKLKKDFMEFNNREVRMKKKNSIKHCQHSLTICHALRWVARSVCLVVNGIQLITYMATTYYSLMLQIDQQDNKEKCLWSLQVYLNIGLLCALIN